MKEKLAPVKQIETKAGMTVDALVHAMRESGVMGAGRLGRAADVLEQMIRDKECTKFFGLAGPMVPGGNKKIIIDFLERGWTDVFVTTGATLTHDLFEALGYSHLQGTAYVSDEELNKKGIDRVYESYLPNEAYQGLEKFIDKNFAELAEQKTIKDFLWKLGEKTPSEKPSILRTCWNKKIPVFCPALADSGIGLMVWGQLGQGKKCETRAFDDLKEIMQIAWSAKRAGVLYVGGGVPKNYVQQAMQLAPKAAEYGVQITTDRPEPGGSSGAELREGISWGKLAPCAKFVDVICDATIALPILSAALKERLKQ